MANLQRTVYRGQIRSKKANWEFITIVYMRDNGDLNQVGGLEVVELQIYFDGRDYKITKGLDLGSVRKRGVKDTSRISGLSNWKDKTVIYWNINLGFINIQMVLKAMKHENTQVVGIDQRFENQQNKLKKKKKDREKEKKESIL